MQFNLKTVFIFGLLGIKFSNHLVNFRNKIEVQHQCTTGKRLVSCNHKGKKTLSKESIEPTWIRQNQYNVDMWIASSNRQSKACSQGFSSKIYWLLWWMTMLIFYCFFNQLQQFCIELNNYRLHDILICQRCRIDSSVSLFMIANISV